MWDNRLTKRNPKAPDFKCRDKACDGVIWPPKDDKKGGKLPVSMGGPIAGMDDAVDGDDFEDFPGALESGHDDIPF